MVHAPAVVVGWKSSRHDPGLSQRHYQDAEPALSERRSDRASLTARPTNTSAEILLSQRLNAAELPSARAAALADHATLQLLPEAVGDVRAGKVRVVAALPVPEGAGAYVRLLGPAGELVAVAATHEGRLTLERVFC